MKFYSTKRKVLPVGLKQAVLESLPADNGLYMPEEIRQLPADFFSKSLNWTFPEMAFEFARTLMNGTIPDEVLKDIVYKTLSFDAPLKKISKQLYCLELFHGPSLAFKDFGARFMSRLMSYLTRDDDRLLDILVATSGDTGGAVALGFLGTPGIRVTILYPKGKVSPLQEKQLTTLGQNITALEVDGSFDDCQRLVKTAFLDQELNKNYQLSSANSINIARLIPQCFYYLRAWQQLEDKEAPIAMVVPSGNFGNITAGLIAHKMGLPIDRFVAANNANRVFHDFLQTGNYQPMPSVSTVSNAMDVGAPSNFERLNELFAGDLDAIRKMMSSYTYSDQETKTGIRNLWQDHSYQVCPHTAVAYLAAREFRNAHPHHSIIFQATAHPAKFLEVVEAECGGKVEIPASLAVLQDHPKNAIPLSADYAEFEAFLQSR
ncbi:threonine synthase [Chitinophagales bacterium]|nr:threonine synthase [Chitinophagales bacterium]